MNYIINLDSRKDRWEKMESQLKQQKENLNIERFSAIRPSWSNLDHYISRMEKDFLLKIMTGHISHGLGTIGVFESQYALWEKCANENRPIMIFEDDVTFQTLEVQEELNLILNEINHNFDMICFFPNMVVTNITHQFNHCIRTRRPIFGAYAYYLHPDFAQKTLPKLKSFIRPFDIQVKDIYTGTNHKCYLSKKYLVSTPVALSRDSNIIQKSSKFLDINNDVYITIHHSKCKTPPFIFFKYKPKFNYRFTFKRHECSSIILRYHDEIIFHLEHVDAHLHEKFDCNLQERQFNILFQGQELI
jgi:GR25 family glycosyltransferase involved in LPS biosynthesis